MPAHPFPNHSQAWPLAGQLSLCRWEHACGYCTESQFPDFRSLHLHVLDKHAIPGWRTIVVKEEEEGENGKTACDCPTAHPTLPDLADQKKASGPNPKSPNRKKLVQRTQMPPSKQLAGIHDRRKQTVKSTHPPTTPPPQTQPLSLSPASLHQLAPTPPKPAHPSLSSSKPPTAAPSAPRHPSGRTVRAAAAHGAGPGCRDGGAGGGGAVVYGAEKGAGAV